VVDGYARHKNYPVAFHAALQPTVADLLLDVRSAAGQQRYQ